MKIYAPFNAKQVERMKQYQSNPFVHPYTCINGHVLCPEEDGLHCYRCEYTQTWIYDHSVRNGIFNMIDPFAHRDCLVFLSEIEVPRRKRRYRDLDAEIGCLVAVDIPR